MEDNLKISIYVRKTLHLVYGGETIILTLRVGFILLILRADGITILFCLSYGAGIPSKLLKRNRASLPLLVLCGIIPGNKNNQ